MRCEVAQGRVMRAIAVHACMGLIFSVALVVLVALLPLLPDVTTRSYKDRARAVIWMETNSWGESSIDVVCSSPWLSNSLSSTRAYERSTFGAVVRWSKHQPLPDRAHWSQQAFAHFRESMTKPGGRAWYRDRFGDRLFGWPLRWCGYGWTHDPTTRAFSVENGIVLPFGKARHPGGGCAVLPVRIRPVMAFSNFLIWVALVSGLSRSISCAKRCWRRMHNQCVKCGYVCAGLRSDTCPECGCAITASAHGKSEYP